MDKIKRAVEELKRQRSANGQTTAIKQKVVVPANAVMNREIDVEYQRTRVMTLNPEHLSQHRIVSFNKNNDQSIGFDFLRTQVLNKMLENNWRTIAITSPSQGCGKTMVAINLAMSIAHHTSRTSMLVDFDLRRPMVAKYLGIPCEPSLNDVFSGTATIAETLINPGLNRLVILPTAFPIKNSSEILSSRKVSTMVSELSERYAERIVMFDLPPILSSDDAMIMLSQVDCVLVVVGNGMVKKTDLEESMRYVNPEKLLGTVLNKSNKAQSRNTYHKYT